MQRGIRPARLDPRDRLVGLLLPPDAPAEARAGELPQRRSRLPSGRRGDDGAENFTLSSYESHGLHGLYGLLYVWFV